MRRRAFRLFAPLALLLAGCAAASPLPVESGVGDGLRAGLLEYEVVVSHGAVTPGSVVVQVTNAGAQAHDLRIDGADATLASTTVLRPGQSVELRVDVPTGEEELLLWCSLPGHRAQGMAATLPIVGG